MPCSPEELNQLAEMLSRGKYKEVETAEVFEEPRPTTPAGVEIRHKMGWLAPFRTQVGAFGPEAQVKIFGPLFLGLNKAYNIGNAFAKRYNDAHEPLGLNILQRNITGIPHERDTQIFDVLERMDRSGNYLGPKEAYSPEVIATAKNIRGLYNDMFKEGGMDPDLYLQMYAPHVRKTRTGILGEAETTPQIEILKGRLGFEDIGFVHELERTGAMQDYEKTASGAFNAYLQAFVRAKLIKPTVENVERTAVDPYFNHMMIFLGPGKYLHSVNDAVGYKQWLGVRNSMLGGPTDFDRHMAYTLDKMTKSMGEVIPTLKGKEFDTYSLYKTSRLLTSMFYSGVLGGPIGTRPASLIRHLFRIVPTFSQFGAYDTMAGMSRIFEKDYIAGLRKRGLLSSPLENVVEQVTMARQAGRAISNIADTSLRLFTASDVGIRAGTVGAAESAFERAVRTKEFGKLPGGKPIRDEVTKLIDQGKIEEARDQYAMYHITNLQYQYGKANRPNIFRGSIGSMAGILAAYPLNTWELYNGFRRQAMAGAREAIKTGSIDPLRDALPLLRQLAIFSAVVMAGKEFLNADLSSVFLHGMMPSSLAIPAMGMHAYQFGTTNASWLAGNVFGLGETDLHLHERVQADHQVLRDVSSFIPGSVFAQDWWNVVGQQDTTSVLKALGARPLAEEANRENRLKARLRRSEQQRERSPY